MTKRKPLEGIKMLMFTLGALLGLWLANQSYSWWMITIIIVTIGFIFDKLIQFLRIINKKNE